MRSIGMTLAHMQEYTTIAQQQGKIDGKFNLLMEQNDIDKAIALARSMRGHVAVILKSLQSIKRKERYYEARTTKGTQPPR